MSNVRTLGDLIREAVDAEERLAAPARPTSAPVEPAARHELQALADAVQLQAEMITELRARVDAQAAQIAAMCNALGDRVPTPPWTRT